MARLDKLLARLHERGGSDLHLAAGLEPRMRIDGDLWSVEDSPVLSDRDLSTMLEQIAPSPHWHHFQQARDVDFAYELEDVARFRVNYFCHEQGLGAVFRRIPQEMLGFEQLALPAAVERLAELDSGLVVVTGPTRSGKSTTLAALVDAINTHLERHILTIEEPVEFRHSPKRGIVTQRGVGEHSRSFATALRGAQFHDADVLLVGALPDAATVKLAVRAAEAGALVLVALPVDGAVRAVGRLVEAFPPDERTGMQTALADTLRAVVAQRLLPRADGGGHVAACEILLRNAPVEGALRTGEIDKLDAIMREEAAVGMQTLDDALSHLLEAGHISEAEAHEHARDKSRFAVARRASSC